MVHDDNMKKLLSFGRKKNSESSIPPTYSSAPPTPAQLFSTSDNNIILTTNINRQADDQTLDPHKDSGASLHSLHKTGFSSLFLRGKSNTQTASSVPVESRIPHIKKKKKSNTASVLSNPIPSNFRKFRSPELKKKNSKGPSSDPIITFLNIGTQTQKQNLETHGLSLEEATALAKEVNMEVKTDEPQIFKAIRELLFTEKSYLHDLERIIDKFLKPFPEFHRKGEKDSKSLIFGDIESLFRVNTILFEKLVIALKDPKMRLNNMADVFIEQSHVLKLYSPYCEKRSKAAEYLKSLKQDSKKFGHYANFNVWLEQHERAINSPLGSELMKPVQRLCRYPLLLKPIITLTPKESRAYISLNKALSKMDELINHVNEKTKQTNNFEKIAEIQGRITNSIVLYNPSRVYLFQASVQEYKTPSEKSEKRTCIYYLFNDILIRTTPTNPVHEASLMDLFHPCTHDHSKLTLESISKNSDLEYHCPETALSESKIPSLDTFIELFDKSTSTRYWAYLEPDPRLEFQGHLFTVAKTLQKPTLRNRGNSLTEFSNSLPLASRERSPSMNVLLNNLNITLHNNTPPPSPPPTQKTEVPSHTLLRLRMAIKEVRRASLPTPSDQVIQEERKHYITNTHIDWLKLKCTFQYESRMIEVFPSPTGCLEEMKRKILLKFGHSCFPHLVIKFADEKNDLITIVFEEDLNIALFDYNTKEFFLFNDPETKLSWT